MCVRQQKARRTRLEQPSTVDDELGASDVLVLLSGLYERGEHQISP